MTIPAIGAISGALPALVPFAPISLAPPDPGLGAAAGNPAVDFASVLGKGMNAVQSAQTNADSLAVQAATGDLTDIHDYTIAATQASLVTELASALRSKGIDAFNQVMGMQA